MTPTALMGQALVAFVAAALLASVWTTRRARLITLSVTWALLLVPFGNNGESGAARLFALTDTVSLLLVVSSGSLAWGKKQPFRRSETLVFALLGTALYLTELGLIPYDLYRWGYRTDGVFLALSLAVLFLRGWLLVPLFLGFVLFRLGVYPNYFDVVVDPILVGAAWFVLFWAAWKNRKTASRENP